MEHILLLRSSTVYGSGQVQMGHFSAFVLNMTTLDRQKNYLRDTFFKRKYWQWALFSGGGSGGGRPVSRWK